MSQFFAKNENCKKVDQNRPQEPQLPRYEPGGIKSTLAHLSGRSPWKPPAQARLASPRITFSKLSKTFQILNTEFKIVSKIQNCSCFLLSRTLNANSTKKKRQDSTLWTSSFCLNPTTGGFVVEIDVTVCYHTIDPVGSGIVNR